MSQNLGFFFLPLSFTGPPPQKNAVLRLNSSNRFANVCLSSSRLTRRLALLGNHENLNFKSKILLLPSEDPFTLSFSLLPTLNQLGTQKDWPLFFSLRILNLLIVYIEVLLHFNDHWTVFKMICNNKYNFF